AVLLVVVGAVLGRVRQDVGTAVAALLTAGPYAVLAGLGGGSGDRFGWPLLWAGVALVAVGLCGPVALGHGHWLLRGPVVLGLAGATLGAAHALIHVDVAATAAVLVVAAVLLARLAPWLGLAMSGTALAPNSPREGPVVRSRVRGSVGRVHDLVLGMGVGGAGVTTLGAPLLVGLGGAGLGIVLATGVLMILRTRQLALRIDVVVGLAGGGATLVSGTVSALVVHPEWAPWLTAVVGGVAVLVVAAILTPPSPSPRRNQLLELAEGLALGALLPLLVVVVGLVSVVRTAGR
ncbi:MAG: hypothetical protein M3Y71_17875, partial [Actinomycetota bacterium]|nr:hypothetical protein [Actinomycetota bacterium]